MPTIKSSTDLRNNYNEQLTGRLELYDLLQEGMNDVAAGRTLSFNEAMDDLSEKHGHKV